MESNFNMNAAFFRSKKMVFRLNIVLLFEVGHLGSIKPIRSLFEIK